MFHAANEFTLECRADLVSHSKVARDAHTDVENKEIISDFAMYISFISSNFGFQTFA